jgi:hypothetical protein
MLSTKSKTITNHNFEGAKENMYFQGDGSRDKVEKRDELIVTPDGRTKKLLLLLVY